MTNDGAVGTSSLTIPLNSAPYCAGTCINLDQTNATFPNGTFLASAAGWSDPDNDALTFEYGIVRRGRNTPLFRDTTQSYSFSGFAVGNYTLYVCVIDTYGASACQTADVSVIKPAVVDSAAVTKAMASINLDQLAASGNDSKLATDAARQMAAVLTTVSSSAGSGSNATLATELAAKKESILKILEASSSGSTNPDDNVILLSTTMGLATATGGAVSPSTGATVLKVGRTSGLNDANLPACLRYMRQHNVVDYCAGKPWQHQPLPLPQLTTPLPSSPPPPGGPEHHQHQPAGRQGL
jgi:hypothetical protein